MARISRQPNFVQNLGQSPAIISQSGYPTNPQIGELLFDQSNNSIFRYQDSDWVLYGTGNAALIPNLQDVTEVGNYTNFGIRNYYSNSQIGIVSANDDGFVYPGFPFAFAGDGFSQFTKNNIFSNDDINVTNYIQSKLFLDVDGGDNPPLFTGYSNPIFSELIFSPYNDTIIDDRYSIGSIFSINNVQNNWVNSSAITVNQGTSINVISPLFTKTNISGTQTTVIDYYAGMSIFGFERLSTGALIINTNYQLLINSSVGFTSTATITNKWGVYQNGILDNNYMSAPLLIGTNVPTGRKLVVNGNIEIQTTAATGVHSPTSLHLPIYVKNGSGTVQLYYLQLLN